jgi:hypothetical protein
MAGTFSQIYIQVVFAVKGRESLIHPSWDEKSNIWKVRPRRGRMFIDQEGATPKRSNVYRSGRSDPEEVEYL